VTAGGSSVASTVASTGAGPVTAPPPAGRQRLHALVAAVCLAGCAALALSLLDLFAQRSSLTLSHALLIAAIVLIGDISLLRIRFGAHGNSFTWGEAALVIGTVIGGWPLLVLAGTTAILVGQLVRRRALFKCAFNAGAFAVGATLARATYGVLTRDWSPQLSHHLSLNSLLALAAAAGSYFLWNGFIVSVALAWSQGLRIRRVWGDSARLGVLMFLGNTAAGLGAVAVDDWTPRTLLLLSAMLLGIYYVYNNSLQAKLDRDRWRDLHAASLQMQHVDAGAVMAAVQRGAEALFGADSAQLLLSEDPQTVLRTPAILAAGLAAPGPVVVRCRDERPRLRQELTALGVVEGVLAPLEGVNGRTGALLVGFRGAAYVKQTELQVVGTFANHASASMQRARLFGEVDEQRARLSAVIDNASDGVVLVGADGGVASWNPGMARLTTRPATSALGRQLDQVFLARCPDGSRFSIARVLNHLDRDDSADHALTDVVLDCADGSSREAAVSVSAVRAAGGACEFAVVVARDITAQRQAQQAKQDFIATVSHELRTPLTPIKGYLSLFLRPDLALSEERRRAIVVQLLDRANQLERLVDDLLSTSGIAHGEFTFRPEPTGVEWVVARAVADLPAADRVSVQSSGRPLRAMCDPARLQQVVANLLSNATKYSPADKAVLVGVHYTPDEVEIAVQDFGAGIPDEQRDEIFEPFRRLGDHLTRKTRGCGLGLHIARQLVEGMGGRIWVDSRLGEGSTFRVTVPTAAELLATDGPSAIASPIATDPVTVGAGG